MKIIEMINESSNLLDIIDYSWDGKPKIKSLNREEIFKQLELFDIEDIESYLRTKKLNHIKNKI